MRVLILYLAVLSAATAQQSAVQVTGRIVDAAAAPVSGATVRLLNAGLEDSTDGNGSFAINGTALSLSESAGAHYRRPRINGNMLYIMVSPEHPSLRTDLYTVNGVRAAPSFKALMNPGLNGLNLGAIHPGISSGRMYIIRIRTGPDTFWRKFPYLTARNGNGSINPDNQSEKAVHLAKTAAVIDSLEITRYGYVRKRVPVSSYSEAFPDIVLTADRGLLYTAQPSDAYLLPVAQKASLQDALDTYKRVRLQEGGDYRSGGPASVTLKNGCRLYGLPGTRVPKIIVAPGTENALLHMVEADIEFPPSPLVTRHNRFMRVQGHLTVNGATLEENLFLDLFLTKIYIDTREGGYLRFNRFIKVMVHSVYPQFVMLGDPQRQSYGNVILWTNFLTSHGDAFIIENQGDLTLVGLDIESWNYENQATKPAAFWTGSTGPIRIFAPNGGTYSSTPNGLFDVAADELQVFDEFIYNATDPNIVFQNGNRRSLFINVSDQSIVDNASDAFRFSAFKGDGKEYTVNGQPYGQALPAEHQEALREMIIQPERPGTPEPWEHPVFTTIPDPAGPAWNQNLASKPDASAAIQALIAANGTARLDSGTYYISQPIILGAGQGIVGAGMDKTVLIAKSPDLAMIRHEGAQNMKMSLVDITLQGGRFGILHPTPGQQVTGVTVSHVTMRDMTEAGICFDKIFGYDNNLLDHVNFFNCPSGFKQITDPNYAGGEPPNTSYMDKTMFYQCQFIGCGVGMDLMAQRANNLNTWVNCLFKNSTQNAVMMQHNEAALFANCDFINNAGDPVISNDRRTPFVNCRFRADERGTGAMVPYLSSLEGCLFDRGASLSATILKEARRNFFYNCASRNMPVGELQDGLMFNSNFALNPELSQQGVILNGGEAVVFLPGPSNPVPQLLVGRRFSNVE